MSAVSDKLVRCPHHGCEEDIPFFLIDTHVLRICAQRCTGESIVENYKRLIDLLLNRASSPLVESDVVLQSKLDEIRKQLEEMSKNNECLQKQLEEMSKDNECHQKQLQKQLEEMNKNNECLQKQLEEMSKDNECRQKQLEEMHKESNYLHSILRGKVMLEVQSAGFECGNYAKVSLGGMFLEFTTWDLRGLNVVVLDCTDYHVIATRSFDVHVSADASGKFVKFIAEQPNCSVLCIAVKDEGSEYLSEKARDEIANLTGKNTIRKLSYRVGYAVIAIKGYPNFSVENMSNRDNPAHIKYMLPLGGIKDLLGRGPPKITTSQQVIEVTANFEVKN